MAYPLGSVEPDQRGEFYAEPESPDARPRFRGLAAGLTVLLVIGLFAGGVWFAYLQGLRHASGNNNGGDDVPLIRADTHPTKVKPDKPGGMEIPDRDKLIYTQKRAAVEHLLPAPEKPMARPTAPGTPVTQSDSQPLAASPAGAVTSSATATANPPGKTAGAAKPATAQSAPAKAGAARIQLGSVRSEEAARQEWERIKRANPDLVGGLSVTPIRADLGDKGVFYRILTGPVADADRVCRELNQRNVGCIIAR